MARPVRGETIPVLVSHSNVSAPSPPDTVSGIDSPGDTLHGRAGMRVTLPTLFAHALKTAGMIRHTSKTFAIKVRTFVDAYIMTFVKLIFALLEQKKNTIPDRNNVVEITAEIQDQGWDPHRLYIPHYNRWEV